MRWTTKVNWSDVSLYSFHVFFMYFYVAVLIFEYNICFGNILNAEKLNLYFYIYYCIWYSIKIYIIFSFILISWRHYKYIIVCLFVFLSASCWLLWSYVGKNKLEFWSKYCCKPVFSNEEILSRVFWCVTSSIFKKSTEDGEHLKFFWIQSHFWCVSGPINSRLIL